MDGNENSLSRRHQPQFSGFIIMHPAVQYITATETNFQRFWLMPINVIYLGPANLNQKSFLLSQHYSPVRFSFYSCTNCYSSDLRLRYIVKKRLRSETSCFAYLHFLNPSEFPHLSFCLSSSINQYVDCDDTQLRVLQQIS